MSIDQQKTIIILGGFAHEGIFASAKAHGYKLTNFDLSSVQPKTWLKRAKVIEELLADAKLGGVFIYLHSNLLLLASTQTYRPAFEQILRQAGRAKAAIFVFQDNLDGVFSMRNHENDRPMTQAELEVKIELAESKIVNGVYVPGHGNSAYYADALSRLEDYEKRKPEVDSLIRCLYQSDIEVAPFQTRADVTTRIEQIIFDLEQGVFLRLYIPDDRLHSEQFRGLLALLERYLRHVESRDFSVNTQRTGRGTVYIFRSDSSIAKMDGLGQAVNRFDSFMKLCMDDTVAAESFLSARGLKGADGFSIVDRYAKMYSRILLDSKHELESKTLLLRQKIETEILEIDAVSVTAALSGDSSDPMDLLIAGGHVTYNINNLSITNKSGKIQELVNQTFQGEIRYNEIDCQLIELFKKFGSRSEVLECQSSLDLIKDDTSSEPLRKGAVQKIKGFLRKAANKALEIGEKVGVEVLTEYLKKQVE